MSSKLLSAASNSSNKERTTLLRRGRPDAFISSPSPPSSKHATRVRLALIGVCGHTLTFLVGDDGGVRSLASYATSSRMISSRSGESNPPLGAARFPAPTRSSRSSASIGVGVARRRAARNPPPALSGVATTSLRRLIRPPPSFSSTPGVRTTFAANVVAAYDDINVRFGVEIATNRSVADDSSPCDPPGGGASRAIDDITRPRTPPRSSSPSPRA
mmetsp:Transcript_7061/g.23263  ORF Transcript_7061/g.23263 Transcript_7061/m.23263 type:complete len:216 (+) Transcript_7061:118-765(+)